jgi:hypothetical protein
MKGSTMHVRLLLAAGAVLTLAHAADVSVPVPPGPDEAGGLQATVLENNILIHPTAYFENTAQALAPSKLCPRGLIVVNPGQPRDEAKILTRPLIDDKGKIDFDTKTTAIAFPLRATHALGTDNQIIRLKDGTFLAFRDAYFWDDIKPAPPWSKELVSGSGDHALQRGGVLIFRSTDGGTTWAEFSAVDFGTFLGGKYGCPRPMDDKGNADVPVEQQGKHANGQRKWWVGGGDRTEVYACPFTGLIYLTTRVVSGPYQKTIPHRDTLLLLYSRDHGHTWQVIREDLPSWSPLVMTSTPNGRLYLLQAADESPMLYFSLAPVQAKTKPLLSPGYPIHYTENGKKILNKVPAPYGGPKGPPNIDLFLNGFHPTISRVSTIPATSMIRVAYQTVNTHGMEEVRVVLVEVKDPAKPPVATSLNPVRAEDPNNASVVYATFVDPDFTDLPSPLKVSATVLYWVEAPRMGQKVKKYAARYSVFTAAERGTAPAYLSVQNGKPRTWSQRQDVGDYMGGGCFWKDGAPHYLCQWVEPDGIKANIVTVRFNKKTP